MSTLNKPICSMLYEINRKGEQISDTEKASIGPVSIIDGPA
ncbi:hypothetical protein [Brucella anthropi]|nr:hypothetical protein [Ochrobactrum sp. MYb49]